MNENTGNSTNDFFYGLLDNPADLSHSNAYNLQLLVNDYPQSGLLRSMLAVKREEGSVQSAAAYVDPKLLYKIVHATTSLRAVADEQIVFCEKPGQDNPVHASGAVDLPNLVIDESNYFHVNIDSETVYTEKDGGEAVYQHTEEHADSELLEDEIAENENSAVDTEENAAEYEVADEQPETAHNEFVPEVIQYPEAEDADKNQEEVIKDEPLEVKDKEPAIRSNQEIDDEVYEEIVSIEDIGLEQLAIMGKGTDDHTEDEQQYAVEEASAEDSYFVFEPTLPEDEHHVPVNIIAQHTKSGGEQVSKYNDEKMPYSFMWWLDKTRKEHAATYQPFANDGKFHTAEVAPQVAKHQPAPDHLQQQYMENIFTVSAVVSDLNLTPPKVVAPPVADTKEDKIIERFIQEEPQIKHPTKAKLNNENKAKKSSEDREELVTETLAKIYNEQMLYHKAILTYKKLMLKFPEKSLYFASQIEQLENKIK